jgi:transposase
MRTINTIRSFAYRDSDKRLHNETSCGDYLKILYYDGTGMCLFAKRLESGKFVWPPIVDGGMILTPAQLALLLEAIDWRRTVAAELPRKPVAV